REGIYMKPKHLFILTSILFIMMTPAHSFAVQEDSTTEKKEDAMLEIMDDMTIEEKIGQLFIVHVYGKTPTDPDYEAVNLDTNRGGKYLKEVIEEYQVGRRIYITCIELLKVTGVD